LPLGGGEDLYAVEDSIIVHHDVVVVAQLEVVGVFEQLVDGNCEAPMPLPALVVRNPAVKTSHRECVCPQFAVTTVRRSLEYPEPLDFAPKVRMVDAPLSTVSRIKLRKNVTDLLLGDEATLDRELCRLEVCCSCLFGEFQQLSRLSLRLGWCHDVIATFDGYLYVGQFPILP
jgi:hypothetical protein